MTFRFKRGDCVVLNGPGLLANIEGVVVARLSYSATNKICYYIKTADYFPLLLDDCYVDAGLFRRRSRAMPANSLRAFSKAMCSLSNATVAFRRAAKKDNIDETCAAAAEVLTLASEPMYRFARHHKNSLINISTMASVQQIMRQYGTYDIDTKMQALPVCLVCGSDEQLAVAVPCGCMVHASCVQDCTCACGASISSTVVSESLNASLTSLRRQMDADRNKILENADACI